MFFSQLNILRCDGCRQSANWMNGSRENQKQTVDYVANLSRQIKESKTAYPDIPVQNDVSV